MNETRYEYEISGSTPKVIEARREIKSAMAEIGVPVKDKKSREGANAQTTIASMYVFVPDNIQVKELETTRDQVQAKYEVLVGLKLSAG